MKNYLYLSEVATISGFSESTYRLWVRMEPSPGPPFLKLMEGNKERIVYPWDEFSMWLRSRGRGCTRATYIGKAVSALKEISV